MLNDRSHNGTQIRINFFLSQILDSSTEGAAMVIFSTGNICKAKDKKDIDSNAANGRTQKHHQIDWEVLQDTIEIDLVSLSPLSGMLNGVRYI